VIGELHKYLVDKNVSFTEAEFTKDHDWIKRYLTKEMYIYAFNVDESDRQFAQSDPEVALAIQAMPKALTLLHGAEKAVGQRMEPARRAAAAH